MYRSFNDFRQLIPFTSDFLIGFRLLGGEFKVNYADLVNAVTNTLSNSATTIARSITGTQIALSFETYTALSTNSAKWDSAYTTVYNITGGTFIGTISATSFSTTGNIISAGRDLSSLFGDSTSTSLTTVVNYLSTNVVTLSALTILDFNLSTFLSAGNGISFVIA